MKKVRVRFAPSPTGPLHLGGVRTALYDYLFAKNQGGDFVLRIEDTDTARYVAEILKTDYAYIAFDTPEELDAIRQEYEQNGEVFAYNNMTRNRLRNSITLTKEEVQQLLDEQVPYVVRFKMPIDRVLNLEDIIRGKFSVNTNTLDDKVLVKNDGMPTYHFANIVDDHEMQISHVIRGEEWLPSLGLHWLLYEAMGWERPEFAHLSLILKPEGKGKLSKRDGDKFGFPVFPLNFKDPATGVVSKGYREEGYLPDAFVNMVALLGWSPADDREILSLEEMAAEFDLAKVHKAGARFSKEKAEWFNQEYLRAKSAQELLVLLKEIPEVAGSSLSDDTLLRIIELMKERAVFAKDIYTEGRFFFEAPLSYDEKAVKKAWNANASSLMATLTDTLQTVDFESDDLKEQLHQFAERHSVGMGKVMMPLRLALVGELKGPDVPDIMRVLGKEECISRIQHAVNNIPVIA